MWIFVQGDSFTENDGRMLQLFEDLCTVPEIKAMSQRFVVAHMLSEKRVYSDIVHETGASTATISRVNRSLIYGCDGYELAFKRIKDGDLKNERKIYGVCRLL